MSCVSGDSYQPLSLVSLPAGNLLDLGFAARFAPCATPRHSLCYPPVHTCFYFWSKQTCFFQLGMWAELL